MLVQLEMPSSMETYWISWRGRVVVAVNVNVIACIFELLRVLTAELRVLAAASKVALEPTAQHWPEFAHGDYRQLGFVEVGVHSDNEQFGGCVGDSPHGRLRCRWSAVPVNLDRLDFDFQHFRLHDYRAMSTDAFQTASCDRSSSS